MQVEERNEWKFKKGFMQLRQADAEPARGEIMSVLKIKTRTSWYQRLNGKIIPKVSEKVLIESVFAKFGVTKNIWGE